MGAAQSVCQVRFKAKARKTCSNMKLSLVQRRIQGVGRGAYPFSNCQKGVGLYSSKRFSPTPPPVYTSVVSLYVWKDKKCRLEFFVQYWTNIFDNSVDLIIFYCIWSFWIGFDRFLFGFDWSDRFCLMFR